MATTIKTISIDFSGLDYNPNTSTFTATSNAGDGPILLTYQEISAGYPFEVQDSATVITITTNDVSPCGVQVIESAPFDAVQPVSQTPTATPTATPTPTPTEAEQAVSHTPTPTVTNTATPTPTQQAPSYYTHTIYDDGSTGWSFDLDACIGTGFPVTVYTAEDATVLQIAQNGYQMFTNTGLTSPFNGDSLYYKSVSSSNSGLYLQINSSGVITDYGTCPSKIYARFVTCGDPAGAVIQVESDFLIDQSAVLLHNGECYEYLNAGGVGVDGDISTFVTHNDCATCEASLTQTYWLLYNCETEVINQRTNLPTGSYAGLQSGDRVTNTGGSVTYTLQGTTTDQGVSSTAIVDTGEIGCPPLCNSDQIYVSTVSAFDAHCTQTVLRTVYHNGDTFANSTIIYGASSDCSTAQAGERWYSDGFFTWYWNGVSKTLIANPPCN